MTRYNTMMHVTLPSMHLEATSQSITRRSRTPADAFSVSFLGNCGERVHKDDLLSGFSTFSGPLERHSRWVWMRPWPKLEKQMQPNIKVVA